MSTSKSNKSATSNDTGISNTTSIVYDHETWDDYVPRVHQLCRQLWPSASEHEDFILEKMKGGSYNRIIGIQTPPSTKDSHGRYILRIPRFERAQQDRELAIVRYVQQHTSIPTAEIIFFDPTPENPLEEPYTVQTRIPGRDLHHALLALSQEQKLAVAEQWSQILLSEMAIQNDFAGFVSATTDSPGTHIFEIRPYEVVPEPEPDMQDLRLISKLSVIEFLTIQFGRLDAADRLQEPDEYPLDHFERLTTVAKEMNAAGLFDNAFFSLCHLDLAPRNIMVDINEDDSLQITGVLDWDSAVFGPSFALCEPPVYLWAWSDEDDEDSVEYEDYVEKYANDTPATPEEQELKLRFEEVVGKDLLKYFYMPEYRLARWLFHLAMKGLRSNEDFKKTERLIEEWKELKTWPSSSSSPIDDAIALIEQVDNDIDIEQ